MKKKVLLYVQVPFMDANLEFIKMVKDKYDVHILIELPPSQLNSNIFSLNIDLNKYDSITSFWHVAKTWNLEYLSDFFQGCSSVNFVIYKPGNPLISVYNTSRAVIKFIRAHKFKFFHLDDFSARQAFILPFIGLKKNVFLNIHDPRPHKGEFEWKRFIIKKLFYGHVSSFITFSEFSKNELKRLIAPATKIFVVNLLPYTVFERFKTFHEEVPYNDRYITFFGRLSPYKGIDILVPAILDVLKLFPNQKFLIAGNRCFGYVPDFEQLGKHPDAVSIIERHITNEEITNILSKSKLVVCPYLEATQSGVVMTSYALNCPVLVTNTGGLAEYVSENITGLIANEISHQGIAGKMIEFLKENKYEKMRGHLKSKVYTTELENANYQVLDTLYN